MEAINKRMSNAIKKRKFRLEIEKKVISLRFLPSLVAKIKQRRRR